MENRPFARSSFESNAINPTRGSDSFNGPGVQRREKARAQCRVLGTAHARRHSAPRPPGAIVMKNRFLATREAGAKTLSEPESQRAQSSSRPDEDCESNEAVEVLADLETGASNGMSDLLEQIRHRKGSIPVQISTTISQLSAPERRPANSRLRPRGGPLSESTCSSAHESRAPYQSSGNARVWTRDGQGATRKAREEQASGQFAPKSSFRKQHTAIFRTCTCDLTSHPSQ